MKKITKAIIPAAGFGTRMLPATKAIPKELIPVVDKPSVQYIVEEAVKSGITDILIITSSGKGALEEHFDRNFELEYKLKKSGKMDLYETVVEIANLANITFIRQKEMKGLGDAISYAKTFVGDEAFAILYGDDVIESDYPVCKQLIDAYEKYELPVVGIKEVKSEDIHQYSSLAVECLSGNEYKVTDMVEKPKTPEEAFSLYSILGRCILTPDIFDILKTTKPGAGGEIQLTDAMQVLATGSGMVGVDFVGRRYDVGNKLSLLEAIVEIGVKHEEIGDDFKKFIKEFSKTL